MTFYDIALKNMSRNFKKYWLYVLSTSFSIIIFYVFVNIKYDKTVSLVAKGVGDYGVMFSFVSYIIAIFSAVFIWYSNSFFMRGRKKEIALFMLVGIKKSKIGRMLFLENFIVGLVSLLIGITGGVLLSKLFIMILLKMMLIHVPITFSISTKAIVTTIVVFAILLIIASLHAYTIVYKVKLIELFAAAKKRETEPKNKPLLAILGIVLIVSGYYISQNFTKQYFLFYALGILTLVIVGTNFLFSATFITLIKMFKKKKLFFYKSNNLITFSNLQYRVKNHSRMLAMIAILTACTISAMGAVYGVFVVSLKDLEDRVPYSYTFLDSDPKVTDEIYKIIGRYKQHTIFNEDKIELVSIQGDATVHLKDNQEQVIESKNMNVLAYSDFKTLFEDRGIKVQDPLKENECFYVNFGYSDEFEDIHLSKLSLEGNPFSIIGAYKFTVASVSHDTRLYVVSDENYRAFKQSADVDTIKNVIGINIKNEIFSKELTNELDSEIYNKTGLLIVDYYSNFTNMSQVRAIILFTGFFLGLVFLTATGSIIYFKMITEASNDIEKYDILRKIGISKRDITRSIASQVFIIFALPLGIGIFHASFALKAFGDMLAGDEKSAFLVAIIFYVCIYAVYYLLTLRHYKSKIIRI